MLSPLDVQLALLCICQSQFRWPFRDFAPAVTDSSFQLLFPSFLFSLHLDPSFHHAGGPEYSYVLDKPAAFFHVHSYATLPGRVCSGPGKGRWEQPGRKDSLTTLHSLPPFSD